MGTPVDERAEHELAESQRRLSFSADGREQLETSLPAYNIHNQQTERRMSQEKSSDGEKTAVHDGDVSQIKDTKPVPRRRGMSHLTIPTITDDFDPGDPLRQLQSPSQSREQANRLNDDLAFLQIERQVSRQAAEDEERSRSRPARSRVRDEHIDEFDEATNPVHEQTAAVYRPLDQPLSRFGKLVKEIHASVWFVRYIAYIAPLTLILLIPLLLGFTLFPTSTVGGVYLPWFMIWLEIVWLTLWLGRIIAKCLPWPIGVVSSLFTNNSKKWRDMGKQLELPATLFFWWLAIEVSFIPTLTNHQNNGHDSSYIPAWMVTMNKVLVSIFVGACLNFIEKVIIQLIAISFHLRTYADRIEINKFQIGSLVKLYVYSKEKIAMEDHEFETPSGPASGARTPGQLVSSAAKTTREAFSKFGDIAGAVAGDFTGKKIIKSTHPHQVILALLNSVSGSQVLARRLYRTFAREETQTVLSDDLKPAFDNDEEASAAFSMFDKDLNGDISMEELEAVCVEIGRERKSITASLKDLDSVVGKLDDVFMFIVLIIFVLVLISLISTSAAGVLTSAGSAVLALSWLFSATAQEFLQSCIFVFVKHPFDVGDRVTVYGNTGSALKGDDYFVKEISLLYTEFKKMEGHIVQAPNSYLNTLFILNQRRSGGLAEALTLTIKFGTTLQQIEGLRNKLLDFVREEKREYQNNILTELRNITDVHSMDLNIVFFYKSNWQNEGLRLARRNKFLCALMIAFQELGIEGPQMRYPGMRQSFPVYLQNIPPVGVPGTDHGHGGHPDNPMGFTDERPFDEPFVAPPTDGPMSDIHPRGASLLRNPRARGESIAAMNRRVDLSLGMSAMASSDLGGNVYDDRTRDQIPIQITQASQSRARAADAERRRESEDMARVTSRDIGPSNLMRRSTDRSSIHPRQSLHRNRFLSRRAGNADQQSTMENGMADIPEATGMSTPATARIDPRSGLVSAAAWRVNTNESNIGSNSSLDKERFNNYEFRAPTRSGTENMEMKRL